MGRDSLSQHERNEVTLFRRGTFSAKHVVAVPSKPFFCFRLIAVALWIRGGRIGSMSLPARVCPAFLAPVV
jgi:hypothetical protein